MIDICVEKRKSVGNLDLELTCGDIAGIIDFRHLDLGMGVVARVVGGGNSEARFGVIKVGRWALALGVEVNISTRRARRGGRR